MNAVSLNATGRNTRAVGAALTTCKTGEGNRLLRFARGEKHGSVLWMTATGRGTPEDCATPTMYSSPAVGRSPRFAPQGKTAPHSGVLFHSVRCSSPYRDGVKAQRNRYGENTEHEDLHG